MAHNSTLRTHKQRLAKRFDAAHATLTIGPVLRARWTLEDAFGAEQHWSDDEGELRLCLAWASSPDALGDAATDVCVVFSRDEVTATLHQDGKVRAYRSCFAASMAKKYATLQAADPQPLFTPYDDTLRARALEIASPSGWHVIAGRGVRTVEVMVAYEIDKKRKAPTELRVLESGARRVIGASVAQIAVSSERFAPVDLSGVAAKASAVAEALGIPGRDVMLFAMPDPKVLNEG